MKFNEAKLVDGSLRQLVVPKKELGTAVAGSLVIGNKKMELRTPEGIWLPVVDFSPALYEFTENTFTSAGRTGRVGPTLSHCQAAYAGQDFLSLTQFFNVITGKQFWTAPADGTYHFAILGASGASTTNTSSIGVMNFDIDLTMGEIIELVVGQRGTLVTRGVGGAGACMVRSNTRGLIAIVGGAGGNSAAMPASSPVLANTTPMGPLGQTAVTAPNGGAGYTNNGGMGSAGGAGYTGSGGGVNLAGVYPGTTFTAAVGLTAANPTGGTATGTSAAQTAAGGYGGGGAALGGSQPGSGGGGGYAGGNAGYNSAHSGSSFLETSLVKNNVYTTAAVTAANRADGSIKITRL